MDNSLDGVVKGWMIVVSLFCTVLSIGFTFSVMYGHLQNFTKPEEQKQIVRVLVLVPFFGLMSFIALLALYAHSARFELYIETAIDLYESYAVYAFMMLMFAYLEGGDDEALIVKCEGYYVTWAVPFCCWESHMDKMFFRVIKVMIVQYVILNPLGIILSLFFMDFGLYCEEGGMLNFTPQQLETNGIKHHGVPYTWCFYPYYNLMSFGSCSIGLYGLIMFYDSISHRNLWPRPGPDRSWVEGVFPKFMTIKAIICVTWAQATSIEFGFGLGLGLRRVTVRVRVRVRVRIRVRVRVTPSAWS